MLTIAPAAAKAGRTTPTADPNATAPTDPAGPAGDPGQVLARIFHVHGRVVLVTGGASGLGLAIATVLANCGARVIIADHDEGRLAAAANELPTVQPAVVDVADPTAVDALVASVVDGHGRLDVAFANAWIAAGRGPADATGLVDAFDLALWQQVLDVN
jgi:NAD(P)-dependent dehydrogenase (short-subunit alcohol dehydrogenase family)